MKADPEHDCLLLMTQFWRRAMCEWNDEYRTIQLCIDAMLEQRLASLKKQESESLTAVF